jgi:hypothetical protein
MSGGIFKTYRGTGAHSLSELTAELGIKNQFRTFIACFRTDYCKKRQINENNKKENQRNYRLKVEVTAAFIPSVPIKTTTTTAISSHKKAEHLKMLKSSSYT